MNISTKVQIQMSSVSLIAAEYQELPTAVKLLYFSIPKAIVRLAGFGRYALTHSVEHASQPLLLHKVFKWAP